jgi:hypothetical protein
VLWGHDGSDTFVAALIPECIEGIERLLELQLRRAVHVVVYATNAEARRALDRDVASDMLLAPFHASDVALLALQAPTVNPRNGDERRMRRHLCHELAHIFAAERTGSVKRLGDGNRGMRIAAWVDEGFAEVLASRVAGQPEVIDAALQNADTTTLGDDEIAAAFDELSSPNRRAAFALATARVWRAVEQRGFRFVFDHLADVHAWRR